LVFNPNILKLHPSLCLPIPLLSSVEFYLLELSFIVHSPLKSSSARRTLKGHWTLTLMLAYASTMLNDVDDYKGIIPPPTLSYPGTELEHYVNSNYPNSPPIPSPEPLPVPPPHFHDSMSITPPTTSAINSTYTSPVIPAFIEDVPSRSPSPTSPMAMVLYQQTETNVLEAKAMDADAEKQTPSPTGPQPGILLRSKALKVRCAQVV